MWVQCVDILGPVVVSPDLATGGSRALSFVYAPDVAGLVAKVARGECDARGSGVRTTWRAWSGVSLQEIVERVAECVREIGDEKSAPGEVFGGARSIVEVREPGRGRKRGWDDSAEATEVGSSVRTSSRQRTSPEFLPLRGRGRDRPVEGDRGARFRADAAPGRGAGDGALVRGDVRGERGRRAQGTRRGCAAVEKKFRVEALLGGSSAARRVATAAGFPEPKDRWGDDAE